MQSANCRGATVTLAMGRRNLIADARAAWSHFRFKVVEAAGVETKVSEFSNLLMVRDFYANALNQCVYKLPVVCTLRLGDPQRSTQFMEASLTTSAVSRDTMPVQAAGAGSQKPGVGGGGRVSVSRVAVSTLLCSKIPSYGTVLPTKHLFGHTRP